MPLLFLIVILAFPVFAVAKGQGGVLLRMPETNITGNSQTMGLLEGYLNSNPVSIGGPTIAIVDDTALSAQNDTGTFVEEGKSGTGQITAYVVRSGDTVGSIAEMFGVSANTIMWANDLKSKTLKVGQELVILPTTGVRHVVKSGDTLQSIAKKYKADIDDVLSYNAVPSNAKLLVGDVIIVPGGTVSNVQSAVTVSIGGQTVSAGYYLRPIRGGVKSQGIHGYNGVDLAAPVGTPIMASADGIVIIAKTSGYNGGYGLYVAIKHANGTQTVYGHMSQVNVAVGESVKQGEVIGAVGNTGHSTGPHVHFEIRGARNPF